ncbi:partial Cyclic AMP receptor protein, partial [Anaerolineae bacterium]
MRDYLRQIPFFSTLSDEDLNVVAMRLHTKRFRKGASVFLAGEPGDAMYFIQSGLVKIISEEGERERFILYLGPGNFFGEGAALFGGNHSASVYVVIDAELLVLDHADLTELIDQHPAMALTIIRELHQRLRLSLRAPIQPKEITLIAVMGDATPLLAEHLAQATGEDVFLFDLGGMGNLPLNQASLAQGHVYLTHANGSLAWEDLPVRLSRLVKQYYWALLWVAPEETAITIKAIDQADLRVALGSAYTLQAQRLIP